jgi:exonuclease SbcD
MPENVHFFPSDRPDTLRLERLGVVLHGRSFGTPAVKTDLAQSYPSAAAGCFNVGVLHTCATGREGHEPYAPCSLETLRAKGYDYWALGHVHRREVLLDDPPVVFAGNTQGRHARETGAKGCYLVTVDDAGRPTLNFKALDVVRWEAATVDASGAENAYDLIDRFREALLSYLERAPDLLTVLRVTVAGETSVHDEILSDPERWMHEIRSATVDEAGERAWIEKVVFRTRPPAGARKPEGAVGELLDLIDEFSAAPDVLSGLSSELADLAKKLPREFKEAPEAWRLDDPNRIKELLAEAKPMLMRRLLQDRRNP